MKRPKKKLHDLNNTFNYTKATQSFSEIQQDNEKFYVISHKGFGAKMVKINSYFNFVPNLSRVANTLTGLELGIKSGADVLEIDLVRTIDGKLVLCHPLPLMRRILRTKAGFLRSNPEALTLDEAIRWVFDQDERVKYLLELKSKIKLSEITDSIDRITDQNEQKKEMLARRIMIYDSDINQIKRILKEKIVMRYKTCDFKLLWLTNRFVNRKHIDVISSLGSRNCKIFGVVQGLMPWGTRIFRKYLKYFLGETFGKYKNFGEVVDYAHRKGLVVFTGTIDAPEQVNWLIGQNVDGVTLDNPIIFKTAGLKKTVYETPITLRESEVTNIKRLRSKFLNS